MSPTGDTQVSTPHPITRFSRSSYDLTAVGTPLVYRSSQILSPVSSAMKAKLLGLLLLTLGACHHREDTTVVLAAEDRPVAIELEI